MGRFLDVIKRYEKHWVCDISMVSHNSASIIAPANLYSQWIHEFDSECPRNCYLLELVEYIFFWRGPTKISYSKLGILRMGYIPKFDVA